ncbi:PIN domain-containing protein [Candidatus Falkowbacteria bacterium]|nr:PIN domain-containing protein [Candidatus Falkowbacteria bacterium]
MKLFLQTFIEVPFDNKIAERASFLRRQYKILLPDAAIAASALYNQVPLVTNDKAFQRIKEISVFKM